MSDFIELTHVDGHTIHIRPELISFFHAGHFPDGRMYTYIRLQMIEPNTTLVRETCDEISATIYAYNQTQRSNNSGGMEMLMSGLGAFLSNNLPKQDSNDESNEE